MKKNTLLILYFFISFVLPAFSEPVYINSINIINENIYNSDTEAKKFHKLINRLHIKTKESTVRKDLLFKKGDLFDTKVINNTARKIRDNKYIHFVYVLPCVMKTCNFGNFVRSL